VLQAFDVLYSLIQASPTEDNSHNCDAYPAIVSVLDLLFKWVTIRMIDNNVQGTTRLVTFLVSLLDLLRHNNYRMNETEATILLPSLCEKVRALISRPKQDTLPVYTTHAPLSIHKLGCTTFSVRVFVLIVTTLLLFFPPPCSVLLCSLAQVGNQKPRFRDGYRMALRLTSLVYPPSRLAGYLLNGIQSKNVRSRAECLDELCYLVRETGYRTVGRKGLQKVATLISTGEKEVRDAAIDVMEALWVQVRARVLLSSALFVPGLSV
jgi:hypothetical protein